MKPFVLYSFLRFYGAVSRGCRTCHRYKRSRLLFFFFPFGIIISFPNNFWGQIILFLSFLFFYFYFYLNFSLSISLVSELSKCTIDLSKLQYFNFIHAVYVRVKFDRKRLHIHDTWLLHPLSKTHHQSNST